MINKKNNFNIRPSSKFNIISILFILTIFLVLTSFSLNNVSAQPAQQINYTTSSSQGLAVTQLDYSPFPANPGEYFDLWLSGQYFGSNNAQTATFQLQPNFPFSLDPSESANQTIVLVGGQNFLVHYKVKVDSNAVNGDNELDVLYTTDPTSNVWVLKKLDVSVANAQTSFAAVIQSSTGTSSGYSFSIVNTGENTANSVIVQVPSQPNFRVVGTNGQVVGNLAAGDYTVVNFNIVPTFSRTGTGNFSGVNTSFGQGGSASRNLTIEIDYTDNIGVRRIVFDTVDFTPSLSGSATNITGLTTAGGVYLTRTRTTSSGGSVFSNIFFWLFVIAIAGGFIFYYKKHPEETKAFFGKFHKNKKQRSSGSETPDWVSAERKKK
ncbi:MAG: hypothetical protein ABSG05_03220 [Candidatus Pacearchaeota archaeon]|jgi:hypothetical protein